MEDAGDMSRHEFSIAYNGSGRSDDHSINVENLAPALLAFGKLLREANANINNKKSKANIYVVSDFEHKCFNVNFELVLSFLDQVKSLIKTDGAKDAKEILEWVGIIASVSGVPGLLAYLKWRNGRKIKEVKTVEDKSGDGLVSVSVVGDGNSITVHQSVYDLSRNPRALRAARDVFLPVGQDGFDRVEVREKEKVVSVIEPLEIEAIVASCTVGIEETSETDPDVDVSSAWLSVYSPVYDESAANWRFRLGTEVIYADISETSISHDALQRGGALADDSYQVRLEITVDVDEKGKRSKPKYKVLEVMRFIPSSPPLRQRELPLTTEDPSSQR